MTTTIIHCMNTNKLALTKTKQPSVKPNNILKNVDTKSLTETSKKVDTSGTFIPNTVYKFRPPYIDEYTWWVPDTSGVISKGRFQGYFYDAKTKTVKNGKKTILKI